jgi:hypothetical protein
MKNLGPVIFLLFITHFAKAQSKTDFFYLTDLYQ